MVRQAPKKRGRKSTMRKKNSSSFPKIIAVLFFLIITISLFVIFFQSQKPHEAHLTLLTVANIDENTSYGGTADVYLEMRPGHGNVYIDTFPFTKLDTQISTRFAKEIACTHTGAVCDSYDFFYTIRADSSIVGGPSAGAALATITAALLEGKEVDDSIAMTGTINSGGLIGPVGGVDEKITAAQEAGLRKVLVPKWSENVLIITNVSSNNVSNVSNDPFVITKIPYISLIENASPFVDEDFEVVEVATLAQALAHITNSPLPEDDLSLSIPDDYLDLMSRVADHLCTQTDDLLLELPDEKKNMSNPLFNQSQNFISQSLIAENNSLSYSRASYCFSANLRLRQLQLENISDEELLQGIIRLESSLDTAFEKLDDESLTTFTDLQTKAIVAGRLNDARAYLQNENVSRADFAYAWERYNSAVIWSSFFSLKGATLQLDETHLKYACETKLAELEERLSYADILFGLFLQLDDSSKQVALDAYEDEDFSLCVFEASKAKAEVDVVLSSVAMTPDSFKDLLQTKLVVAASLLERELIAGNLPLMAYSYYEYAGTLAETDPYTAALYSSYALELSDLSAYFPKFVSPSERILATFKEPFVLGLFAGMSLLLLALLLSRKE